MIDYKNGKIYRLVCNTTGDQYIGSTTQSLSQRLGGHKTQYKRFIEGKITKQMTSYSILSNNNFEIILLEEFACENKNELERRERHFIDTVQCVNKMKPARTKEDIQKTMRTYRQKNQDKIKEREQAYRQENQDKIKERTQKYYQENKKEKQKYKQTYYQEHKGGLQKKMQMYYQENKEELQKYMQTYYQENKEDIQKKRQTYYQENKEDIQKKRQAYRKKLKENKLKES